MYPNGHLIQSSSKTAHLLELPLRWPLELDEDQHQDKDQDQAEGEDEDSEPLR